MTLIEAERLIEASDEYRLLRRVPPVEHWALPKPTGELKRAVLVDTETTGLDQDTDEVIELALLPFEYERDTGRIVRVDKAGALSTLRQPSFPIPTESTRLHGISDADVAGKTIDAEQVRTIVESAHLIIAHTRRLTGRWSKSTGRSLSRSIGRVRSSTSIGKLRGGFGQA